MNVRNERGRAEALLPLARHCRTGDPLPSDGIPHPCWELRARQPVLGSLLCLGRAHCACMNLLFLKPEKAKGVGGLER